MLSGLSTLVIALSVGLSALIRLVQIMQLRQRVSFGHAGVRELSELSGILDPKDLQDIFGPPGINRVWTQLNRATIERHRRLPGYLMSDHRLHWASIAVAFVSLGLAHWTVELALLAAVIVQLGAWISALRLPK